ncbi:hypothetical protein ADK35_08030 [Streptomyces viridochromogenes]|uniref:DUF7739 domain-containing protein n=1 Tax=Streptomyces viridochromogenes TaxID=1938 RepID=UPI00069EC2FE|nr:hypothetical protein [Streptomyces viridochromogenes]KOG25963.1 hypothetical protein ADK35_08030 [Streptomyces viridochromogenes]
MTTTTRDAATHAVVSHGADFFGEDRHTVKDLVSLAPYVSNAFSWADRGKVAPLLQILENPSAQAIPAPTAEEFAAQLLKASRTRGMKARWSALARALADAAARAAADGEPWDWRIEAGADA